MAFNDLDLGMVTAYAYAVEGGYEGTEEEFTALLGNIAIDLSNIENLTVTVSTLPAGSSATASYADGVLSLGIPKGDKGDKGDKGNKGDTGATPDLSIGTVTTGAVGSDAAATITGTAAAPVLNLTLPRGATGDVTNLASTFSSSVAYSKGDYVIYNDLLYVFTANHAAGSWSGTDATQVKVGTELTALKEDFTELPDYGYVPTAGQMMSDNVTVDTEPYSFRATPYGDREIVDGIVGGTVAFNQLAQGDFASATWWYSVHANLTVSNNEAILELTDLGTREVGQLRSPSLPIPSGHVVFGCGELFTSVAADKYMSWGGGLGTKVTGVANAWQTIANVVELPSFAYSHIRLGADSDQMTGGGTVKVRNVMVIDLTQALTAPVAYAIYAMEQSAAGSGVAYLKAVAPKMFAQYNPYNSGELMSVSGLSAHETVGFNVWDEEWEIGAINATTGENSVASNRFRCKNYIPVIPNIEYCFGAPNGSTYNLFFYDADKNFLSVVGHVANTLFRTLPNARYIRFYKYSPENTTYAHDICINLSDPTRNGEYQPYVKHTYALDDSLTLMGVPKWDNGLKFDGDIYTPSGGVGRRYGIVDLGTLDWELRSMPTGAPCNRFRIAQGQTAFKGAPAWDAKANIICTKMIGVDYNSIQNVNAVPWTCTVDPQGDFSAVALATDYADAASFKAAMNGVYLVYEKATPTTETAEPYQSVQVCPNGGTEKYISTSIVPVGHSTRYPENSRAKLDGLPWDFSTLIAPTEKAYKATRNYTTGQLLIVSNILYKVTANIANGGNIVPNTNVTPTTLAEVISAL